MQATEVRQVVLVGRWRYPASLEGCRRPHGTSELTAPTALVRYPSDATRAGLGAGSTSPAQSNLELRMDLKLPAVVGRGKPASQSAAGSPPVLFHLLSPPPTSRPSFTSSPPSFPSPSPIPIHSFSSLSQRPHRPALSVYTYRREKEERIDQLTGPPRTTIAFGRTRDPTWKREGLDEESSRVEEAGFPTPFSRLLYPLKRSSSGPFLLVIRLEFLANSPRNLQLPPSTPLP